MTVTARQASKAAWYRGWGLEVDDRLNPSKLQLFQSPGDEPESPKRNIASTTYTTDPGHQMSWMFSHGVPTGTAKQLANYLNMKLVASRLRES